MSVQKHTCKRDGGKKRLTCLISLTLLTHIYAYTVQTKFDSSVEKEESV